MLVTASSTLARLKALYSQLPDVRTSGRNSHLLPIWETEVKLAIARFYGEESLEFKELDNIRFDAGVFGPMVPEQKHQAGFARGIQEAQGFLQARIEDLESQLAPNRGQTSVEEMKTAVNPRKVFVIHGHDHHVKEKVARYLSKLGLDPIILHEQPNQGRTLIEKFEHHANEVACAVAILTADDLAAPKNQDEAKELRARQNVIFELGFFFGLLGRNRTFALLGEGVIKPSDIDGLVYISLATEAWKTDLARELKAAGMSVSLEAILS